MYKPGHLAYIIIIGPLAIAEFAWMFWAVLSFTLAFHGGQIDQTQLQPIYDSIPIGMAGMLGLTAVITVAERAKEE